MNQTNGKLLTLNPQEARNLHAEIYDLMATNVDLNRNTKDTVSTVVVSMDGGTFK